MIGIVCAFFHTEGKGFYSKHQHKAVRPRLACAPFLGSGGGRKSKARGKWLESSFE